MYPVSQDYQEMIKKDKNKRLFEAKIKIEHSKGTLDIGDKELVQSALTYTESSQSGEEFTIGGTVASDIKFTILNKPEYEDIIFMGATVFVSIGLQIKEGMDAHFIQPSQPSKIPGFEEKWEYVPLGRFNIDDVNKQRNTIELKAIDNMINLDKPYSLSKLSYPATLYQIYINICNVADVNIGTTNFINKDYVVQKRPEGDLSLRDVLGYVAELAGSFARMNRNGALELKWYTPTGLTLDPSNRFDFKPSDDSVQIKGIMATVEDKTYLSGSEDYAIDLTENPLLQGGYETVLPNIFNKVKDTVFTPYTSNWQGNMSIQAGDIITQVDRDGKIYKTLVTKSVYKYRGRGILEAKGLPEISKGYKGSTNRKIAEIKRKVEEEVGDKITDLEQAILEATELITGQLGGYVLKRENELLIMDNPDPAKAQKIWRWNLAGLGYSNTGINGPYGLAMTMDGAINANFITTGLLSANLVKTGILSSQNGKLSLNLNNASFSFENGVVQFTPQGLKIKHVGSNQYSEVNFDGFKRQWEYGTSEYLSDIWVHQGLYSGFEPTEPHRLRMYLPDRFRGRAGRVKVEIIPSNIRFDGLSRYEETLTNIEIVTEIIQLVITNSEAYVDVFAYSMHRHSYSGSSRYYYKGMNFDLLVVGY